MGEVPISRTASRVRVRARGFGLPDGRQHRRDLLSVAVAYEGLVIQPKK